MTGYMFRNAQYRLELQESLEQVVALPDVQDKKVTLCLFLLFFSILSVIQKIFKCLDNWKDVLYSIWWTEDLFIWTFGQVISYPY